MPSLATWFTPSLQTISRSAGRSSVLAAAYRACEKLTDERLGITSDYTPKGKHGLTGNICVGIPNDDIALLFNNAEKAETRANSTVARELMVPLSSEWSDHERSECVRAIAQHLRDEYGVAVLASIHRPAIDNNNDHAHILFTTRTVDAKGIFGKKTRILDDAKTGEVKKMREAVCEIVNTHARANGSDWYVYAGKFSDIIEDYIPTTHISIKHGKKQKQYIDANRETVKEAQAVIAKTKNQIAVNDAKIAALTAQATIEESSQKAPTTSAKANKEHAVAPTRAQVYERLRSYPELAELADEAEAGKNEPLFELLLKFESDIKIFGSIQPEEEKVIDWVEYMQDPRIKAENERIADELKAPKLHETTLDKALRLRAVFEELEVCRKQREDFKDLLAYRGRQLDALNEKAPGFLSLPSTKKEHKVELLKLHANILGAQSLIDENIAYINNKTVQQQSNEYCSNTHYKALCEQHDATLPLSLFDQMRADKVKQLSLTKSDCAKVVNKLVNNDLDIQKQAYGLVYGDALSV
ncbi:MAG: MobA/MobL family protein [Polaromonas sp.]|uniref:MobA/MobL family protein n=1 Tax=Polaromonas sp. TaxID=1869339 RepID=UPI0017D898AB|nr:MobA/MobL family protein [Polaromonas sp.]NMM10844.1 MobA/MobL family protein [Polaromonas sp.]